MPVGRASERLGAKKGWQVHAPDARTDAGARKARFDRVFRPEEGAEELAAVVPRGEEGRSRFALKRPAFP